jgi:hypothetical protein
MLGNTYFYNKSLKKIVAVFGTLFNNISIAKLINGKMQGISRVPLTYAPRQKFLARLASFDPNSPIDVAVRLPRMSFEITSIAYDTSSKLNRLNSTLYPIANNSVEKTRVYQSTPYTIGIQLNILARHQDDALQVLEQILPYFCPEYSVTVKDFEGPDSRTDIPIILQGISFQDDYEGDFQASRRTIIYTLDFSLRVKFSGPLDQRAKIIKAVDAHLYPHMNISANARPEESVHVQLGDMENDTVDNYTVLTTFGFIEDLPPVSDTLTGLQWQVDRNVGGNLITDTLSGRQLNFVAPITSADTSELTLSTRFFNNYENQDPEAASKYGPEGEITIYLNWLDNPQYGKTPGYVSSEPGDYIKVYANGELVLSSEDGTNTVNPTRQSITIAPNQEVIITYRILQSKRSMIDATVKISYEEE